MKLITAEMVEEKIEWEGHHPNAYSFQRVADSLNDQVAEKVQPLVDALERITQQYALSLLDARQTKEQVSFNRYLIDARKALKQFGVEENES